MSCSVRVKMPLTLFQVILLSLCHLFVPLPVTLVAGERTLPQPKFETVSNVEVIRTNTSIFKLIIDTVGQQRGSLIVGARNQVMRVNSSSLAIIDFRQNGPLNDSLLCRPSAGSHPDQCPSLKERNNDHRVVISEKDENGRPRVIVCGTTSQGMCFLVTYYNFSKPIAYMGSGNQSADYVASDKYTLAFPIKHPAAPLTHVIGHEYDGRPLPFSPPTLSLRRAQLNLLPSFHYNSVDGHPSQIDVKESSKESYHILYQYGFHDDDYYYVISNQRIGVDSHDYEGRIARVCLNDTSMTTYTELMIRCSENARDDDPKVWNIITAAHYGKSVGPLARDLNVTSAGETLFLAFATTKAQEGYTVDPLHGSTLCAISMDKLNGHFNTLTKNCMSGSDEAEIHPAFVNTHSNPPNQEECVRMPDINDYCAKRYTNSYIAALTHKKTKYLIRLPDDKITSVATYTLGESTIALIGTERGEIIKSNLASPPEVLFRQRFLPPTVNDGDTEVRPEPVIDEGNNFAFFALSNSIVKFPLKSCSIYAKCSQCVLSKDPLGCGWCRGKCSTGSECSTPVSSVCSPVIFDFNPKSGPTNGSTEITIIGDNFGHAQSGKPATVTIESGPRTIKCSVTAHENEKIVCKTDSAPEMSGRIHINVLQVHNPLNYNISGTGISPDFFSFKEANVAKIFPRYGPRSGGAKLHITGRNLHIGSKRSIQILNHQSRNVCECTVTSFTDNEIICVTTHKVDADTSTGTIFVTIDAAKINTGANYTLKDDPVVSSISPTGVPLSAKINVEVRGKNLDSVAKPALNISGANSLNLIVPCETISGESLSCPLPLLDKSWSDVVARVYLSNDDVVVPNVKHSRLNFHPDPLFANLTPYDTVSLGDLTLTLRGTHLTKEYPVNVTLGHDRLPCQILECNNHYIKCVIKVGKTQPSVNDTISVSYSIGAIEKDLGYVTFIEKIPESSGFSPYLLFLIIIVAVAAGSFFYVRRSRLEKAEFGHVVYTNEPSPRVLNDYSSTGQGFGEAHPLINTWRFIDDESIALLRSSNKLIAREYLVCGDIVGKGNFGKVFKGSLERPDDNEKIDVAIKTLQHFSDMESHESFVREALIMKDFKHSNVMTLIGLVFPEDSGPLLVLPFMCNGDLLRYVRDETREPRVRELLKFSLDIAKGMEYLASQKFVHRDLAARNCMLDENLNVCVADFGLSRDVYEKGYYKPNQATPLPYKWMAPESLKKFTFTTKSDVWSYGVTSWELITRGFVPYSGIDNMELAKYLDSGRRLEKPAFCPERMYQLWLTCWSYDPTKRPTFADVVAEIETYIAAVEEKTLQTVIPSDPVYGNVANGRYYNDTSDADDSSQASAQASTSRQPVNNIMKAPAETPVNGESTCL